MQEDIKKYFLEQYTKARFRVVPGHWPDFQSKNEVDQWFVTMNELVQFAKIYYGEVETKNE